MLCIRNIGDTIIWYGPEPKAKIGAGCERFDDGAGCVMAMEAINVLRKLKMVSWRTIRVVLWTNEENGLNGGKAYAKDHEDELKNHVAAIESDLSTN